MKFVILGLIAWVFAFIYMQLAVFEWAIEDVISVGGILIVLSLIPYILIADLIADILEDRKAKRKA